MSTPKLVSHRQLAPPYPSAQAQVDGEIRFARLSQDGTRVAFVADDGAEPALCVWTVGTDTTRKIVRVRDRVVDELRWSPNGTHLAYVAGSALPTGVERSVAWASTVLTGAPPSSSRGRVDGAAFAWVPSSGRPADSSAQARPPSLIVADLRRRAIMHVNLQTGAKLHLGSINDDGNVLRPPTIALPQNGKHIAFTCQQQPLARAEVWLLSRGEDETEPKLLTQIPGTDVRVRPLWSPKGRTLALNVVHPPLRRSALIAVVHLKGDGVILHSHELCDSEQTPAWSPSGRYIAMFVATAAGSQDEPIGAQQLALLDTKTRTMTAVEGVYPQGRLHFIDGHGLAIDGGSAVELLTFDMAL